MVIPIDPSDLMKPNVLMLRYISIHLNFTMDTWLIIVTLQVSVLVMCHTRELAFQISKEYERFSKFLPSVKVGYI